jgi:hypothetical protein
VAALAVPNRQAPRRSSQQTEGGGRREEAELAFAERRESVKKNGRKGLSRRRLDVQFMLTKMENWKFGFDIPTATGAPIPVHPLRTIR